MQKRAEIKHEAQLIKQPRGGSKMSAAKQPQRAQGRRHRSPLHNNPRTTMTARSSKPFGKGVIQGHDLTHRPHTRRGFGEAELRRAHGSTKKGKGTLGHWEVTPVTTRAGGSERPRHHHTSHPSHSRGHNHIWSHDLEGSRQEEIPPAWPASGVG
ncbi:Hypothetical predicted protein [Pelobates cultripes]|uniref:Uncharacterized protein n=1 Tax=Pelobates cultripes TaxID=61616 RepID=A0AAD1WW81_PELCU|nr:Hypothetical predicted protein [Pelobates cultripes]